MDDQSFDDFIKNKLDQYEDPEFDPSAFAGLKDRLAAVTYIPWYVKYRTEAIVLSSFILFTFFNGYLYWAGQRNNTRVAEVTQHRMQFQEQRIDSLTHVLNQLKSSEKETTFLIDSINDYYLKHPIYRDVVRWHSVESETAHLSQSNENLQEVSVVEFEDHAQLSTSSYMHSPQLFKSDQSFSTSPFLGLSMYKPRTLQAVEQNETTHQKISAKTKNELEKHYFNRLGIQLAPHMDLVQGIFSIGTGKLAPRVGITADWLVSPRFSIETSFDYSIARYVLKNDFQNFYLPSYERAYGDLVSTQVNNQLLSLPVSIKYRQWLTDKHQIFFNIGFSPYFNFATKYEMRYVSSDTHGPDPDDVHTLNQVVKSEGFNFYGQALTTSLGITKSIKDKNKMEAALFYEKSLGSVGVANQTMQLIGVRTAFWFRLR